MIKNLDDSGSIIWLVSKGGHVQKKSKKKKFQMNEIGWEKWWGRREEVNGKGE